VSKKEGVYEGVFITAVPITKLFARVCVCVLLLQDLLQSCARGGRRRVEDMCYERRRAEACVDCVKGGGGAEGECERKRALGVLLCHSLRGPCSRGSKTQSKKAN
jgi:hypothetical protein